MFEYLDILNYFFNSLLFFYLLDNKKKLTFKNKIVIIIIALFTSTIIFKFLYAYLFQKNIITLASFIITGISIYHLSVKKIIFKYFIFLVLSFLNELLAILFFHNYLENGFFHMSYNIKIIFVIFINLSIYIFIRIYYCFVNEIYNYKKFKLSSIIMLMIISISSLLAIFNTFDIIKYYENLIPLKNYAYIMLFIIWLFLIIMLFRQFKIQLTKIKEDILISKYNEEYQKKLLSSIKEENDEYYSRLRHDLINYIETKQTIDKNK